VFRPKRVCRIKTLEIRDEPRAVELAVPRIAEQSGHPSATEQASGVSHRILLRRPRPIGQGRSSDNDRTKELRPHGGKHHDCPASLAISNHGWLAISIRMQTNYVFEEFGFRFGDIRDGLTGNRIGKKSDEVTGMARLHRNADFALRLEAADTRPMSGPRIDDHKGTFKLVRFPAVRRNDVDQRIIYGLL